MATTNGVAPARDAVPDLADDLKLAIVQAQIEHLQIEAYKLEALSMALPPGDAQAKEAMAQLKRTRKTVAGYRTIEGELLGRMG